jgi:hypothetical protein
VRERRRRREVEATGLSFLDCICCGFGAIILLLVITKIREPAIRAEVRDQMTVDVVRLDAQQDDLQDKLEAARAERELVEAELLRKRALRAKLQASLTRLTSLPPDLPAPEPAPPLPALDPSAVLGLPADSEYVIFILDTSGSMRRFNWGLAIRKISEVLDVYPRVRGLQVLNDMGSHMFSSTRGKWLPDTPAGRRRIRQYISSWSAFSNSSPVEGIETAIRTYWASDRTISIYVFGDEFTGSSIQAVVESVDRLNRKDAQGKRRVRIHGIGFPLIDPDTGILYKTTRRFASLMRILCERNGGTFIGLQPG